MQLIRYCREVIESDILDNNSERAIFSWLAKQLSKNNTIVIEVAKTMVAMKNISNNELIAVVSSLSLYLLSMSPINVYSALKILDKMLENPAKAALLSNTSDIESLLSNSNKAVKSLALSILLKVSREDKIVELLDKTYEIFSELPDSIKIGVISSCEDISRKYPEKTKDIIFFLCRCIRDRGELEFKIKAIKRVTKMMKKRKEFYDKVFDFFCEYIEDPYSPKLVLIILNIFVENIEHCSDPRKCLRFILNRLHLDESKIRSAAITCLGEIGKKIPGVREECFSIVSCYVKDIDDEVRERAFYYSNLIDERPAFVESYNEEVFQLEVLENIQSMIRQSLSSDSPFDLDDIIAKREPLTPGGGHVKPSQPSALAPQYAESPTRGAANPLEGRPDKNMLAFIKDHEDYAEYGELKLSRPAVVGLSKLGRVVQGERGLRDSRQALLRRAHRARVHHQEPRRDARSRS
jgi:coatomer protein complex subunit gamma